MTFCPDFTSNIINEVYQNGSCVTRQHLTLLSGDVKRIAGKIQAIKMRLFKFVVIYKALFYPRYFKIP